MPRLLRPRRLRRLLTALAAVGLASGAVVALNLPTPAAVASITVTPDVATAPIADSNGYSWVSYYRSLAGLGAVARNAMFEAQIATHLRYLADHAEACETNVHDELTSAAGGCGANSFATAGGKAAANNSDITRVSASVSDQVAVSNWFGAAFHALVLLDPRLSSTGYAAYYTPAPRGAKPLAWPFTAGVDVYRGRSGGYDGALIAFPGNHVVSPLLSYAVGTESPEPFRTSVGSCRSWGSKTVVSAPVIVQWRRGAAGAGASGVIVDVSTGKPLPTCTLNGASYAAGSLGRQFLNGSNGITTAAFYYAATPFIAGHRYQLRIAGRVVTDFTTSPLASAVTARAASATRGVTVSWNLVRPGAGTVRAYTVTVFTAVDCGGAQVVSTRTAALSASLGGLIPGRYYGVRVRATNSAGAVRMSNCVGFRAR